MLQDYKDEQIKTFYGINLEKPHYIVEVIDGDYRPTEFIPYKSSYTFLYPFKKIQINYNHKMLGENNQAFPNIYFNIFENHECKSKAILLNVYEHKSFQNFKITHYFYLMKDKATANTFVKEYLMSSKKIWGIYANVKMLKRLVLPKYYLFLHKLREI